MPIHELLFHEYDFSEKEALSVESFLMPMLEYDPKKRISAREALRHPWLWSDDWLFYINMKRGMRSVGSMSDFAEYFNETIKSRASDTLVAGKFVANKVWHL